MERPTENELVHDPTPTRPTQAALRGRTLRPDLTGWDLQRDIWDPGWDNPTSARTELFQ